MKKFFALLLSLTMILTLAACGGSKSEDTTNSDSNTEAPADTQEPASDFKVGFITLHDENSTYDLNFINAAKAACEKLGVEYTLITNVPEG